MKLFKITLLFPLALCLFACGNSKQENSELEFVKTSGPAQTTPSVIYNSTDGGNTWTPFDNGIPTDATVSSFLVTGNKIFVTTIFHGIYSINDSEKEWKRIDEDLPEKVNINAISTIGNSIVIGTLSHGIMVSKNNGKHWNEPAVQIKGTPIRGLHAKGNTLFAGTDNGIYRSLDNGNTWEHVWKGVQVNGFAERNDKIYAALMNGAAVKKDNDSNWEYIYKPHTLHDISTDGEGIYAMTLGAGLKKSNNDGLTWENINNGLGTLNLYTFELKKFGNTIFAAQWYGIYRSDNGGKSWSIIKNGLPDSTAFTTLEVTRRGLIAGIGLRKKSM
jgi:photosystem II stability/assembly factor-like uncharacterized protein